ncbi:MAG: hypothetical protein ACRC1Z_15930 [Waterburya sp.]
MLEVIWAGSLFLSVKPSLPNNSPDLALIHASQSTLVQADVRPPEKSPGLYLAESEAEAEYRRNLEQLMDRYNIIIQDPKVDSEDSSDDDAEQRRRELEQENNDYDGMGDSGNEHESDYSQEAEDARYGDEYDVDVSDSDEDSSDDDAAERRRELDAEYQSTDGDETEDSGDEHTSKYSQEAEDARNGDFSSSDENSNEDEDSSDDDAAERRQELGF